MAEACYIDLYLPASFKGVAFEAMDISSEHGRRGAEGEFPFGEDTAYADMGRRIRTYSLSGRLVENTHIADADALIAACESPGPGILIHPTRGILTVACKSLKVTDDPLTGQGQTLVNMEFVEANSWATGFNLGSGLATGLSLAALIAVLRGTFEEQYVPEQAPFFQVANVTSPLSALFSSIRREFTSATATVEDQIVWSTILDLEQAEVRPSTLLNANTAFETINLGFVAVSQYTLGVAQFDAFKRIANDNAGSATLRSTAGRSQEVVYSTARSLAAAYMARGVLEEPADTISKALQKYDQVSAILGEEIMLARLSCDNVLYMELRRLLTSAQKMMLNKAYNLPALVTYDFGHSTHSLMAAYEIFDDAKRFSEIQVRNPTQFPWAIGPQIIAGRL